MEASFQPKKTILGALTALGLEGALRVWGRLPVDSTPHLGTDELPYVPGLRRIRTVSAPEAVHSGIVIGTLRMGYGHYRFAIGIADAALAQSKQPIWHDFTGLDVPHSRTLGRINAAYSRASRFASEGGDLADSIWETFTGAGDWSALHASFELARIFTPLLGDLDRSLPFISTFVWTGQIARHAGFRNIVHLVNDNAPMPFIVTPGALNLVQSPSMYAALRSLGVPSHELELAGHWVPQTTARAVGADTQARLHRLTSKRPRRLLLSIGGAGSQYGAVARILRYLAPALKHGRCSLLLNAGDHRELFDKLTRLLESLHVPLSTVTRWEDGRGWALRHALGKFDSEPRGATVFHVPETFPAVLITEHLIRCADVLITKPSELAFYPIPMILLRRVGRHEGLGAQRAAELGAGTPECRDWPQTRFFLDEVVDRTELLERFCERIASNAESGIYDGAMKAVQIASTLC